MTGVLRRSAAQAGTSFWRLRSISPPARVAASLAGKVFRRAALWPARLSGVTDAARRSEGASALHRVTGFARLLSDPGRLRVGLGFMSWLLTNTSSQILRGAAPHGLRKNMQGLRCARHGLPVTACPAARLAVTSMCGALLAASSTLHCRDCDSAWFVQSTVDLVPPFQAARTRTDCHWSMDAKTSVHAGLSYRVGKPFHSCCKDRGHGLLSVWALLPPSRTGGGGS